MDERIEKLIVRRLDGELGEEDELELNRELIRNPAARRLMEEYGKVDELAAVALRRAVGDEHKPLDVEALSRRTVPRSVVSSRWGWRLGTGAVAAALLAIFVARFPLTESSTRPSVANGARRVPIPQVVPSTPNGVYPNGLMRDVSYSRPRIRRDTGREIFGVVGEDGSIYWIEVDRTWTIGRPKMRAAGPYPAGEM